MDKALISADWIVAKVRADKRYAQNLYAAMCNTDWQRIEVLPILKNERWHCSWRGAGGIVANLRACSEDYMDWYCSGITGGLTYDTEEDERIMAEKRYVPEGTVTEEIRADLETLGWRCIWDDGKEEWDRYIDTPSST